MSLLLPPPPYHAQGLADGLKLLVRAYELDPQHVGTLNMLAHYCLLRADYEKVWEGVGGCGSVSEGVEGVWR